MRRGRQALQLHGWRARQVILRCGARGGRRTPHQPRRLPLSRRNGRARRGGAGDEGKGDVCLCRHRAAVCGACRIHVGMRHVHAAASASAAQAVPPRRRFTTMASASDGRRDCGAQRSPTPADHKERHLRDQPANYLRGGRTEDEGRWIADGEGSRTGSVMARLTSLFAKLGSRCAPLDSSPLQPQGAPTGVDGSMRQSTKGVGLVRSRARDACDASSGELRPTAEPYR